MTTPPTPEPSAEALAAETKVADYLWRAGLLNPYNNQTGNELVRIIDAEFAALRARLERAEELAQERTKAYADHIDDMQSKLTKRSEALIKCEAQLMMCRDHFAEGQGMESWARQCMLDAKAAREALGNYRTLLAPSAKPGEGGK